MNIHVDRKEDSLAKVSVSMTSDELVAVKTKVLKKLAPQVKVAGFREGKVPLEVAEKSISSQTLQSETIDEAVNSAYVTVLKNEKLRPISQPKVEITKFVPFTTLDLQFEIPVVGKINLPDYKKTSVKREKITVTKKDIESVIENLRLRMAEKKEVDRPAKKTDEVWIDFQGVDKNEKEVEGASGTDYPLVLGSGTFIPGFEDNVIGLKKGDKKTFTVTFPKDYGVKKLQNAKVVFTVTVKNIKEIVMPALDKSFAEKVGLFTSLEQLTADIEKQLMAEKQQQAERNYEAALLDAISAKTKVTIPDALVQEQLDSLIAEVRQNVLYRGMTWQQYLESQQLTEEEYKEKELKPEATKRVKAGLILSEIADLEGIDVSPEELEIRMQELKSRYKDSSMLTELEKPETRREIAGRVRTEKVLAYLKTV
jgi:trigger factor